MVGKEEWDDRIKGKYSGRLRGMESGEEEGGDTKIGIWVLVRARRGRGKG